MWNLKHFTHDNDPQVAPVLLDTAPSLETTATTSGADFTHFPKPTFTIRGVGGGV